MACPLCNENSSRASWLGTTTYRGKQFLYLECLACKSLYCDPMPDNETLAQMYGPQYEQGRHDPAMDDPKEPARVIDWLRQAEPGTFLDYGCGSGELLSEAAKLKWNVLGVEFGDEVAKNLQRRTGFEIITSASALDRKQVADVLHLGDVIEHLTSVPDQIPEILKLIKPGGLLIAQGPLEGNLNLFTLGLRGARGLGLSSSTEMPPYHVMLATSDGQQRLFKRFGLSELEYSVREVAWPAPARISSAEITHPRLVALFTLRKLSQAGSLLFPKLGNRYFYVGRLPG